MNKTSLVIDYILKEIEQGTIQQGQRLPSCRKLALLLGINKITVNKSYSELEKRHLVYSIPCGGFYLIMNEIKLSSSNNIIDFKTVKPEENLIPYREFTHVINTSVNRQKNALFTYEHSGCHPLLRETLKSMYEKDGIHTPAERILITSGAQQAIALAFQILFKMSAGKLLVEVPTYGLAIELANQLGIPMEGIVRTEEGFDLKKLETLFKSGEITAFYVVPRHHNPTGFSLDEKTKRCVARLASLYGVRIIEDDYLSELGSKKNYLPIHYYDTTKQTIHIRSFSKTFMPGIRIGVAILPEDLSHEVIHLKRLFDLNSSQLPQAALHLFIQSGMYEKHTQKIKRIYAQKLKFVKELMLSMAPKNLYWYVPDNGIYVWMVLPLGMSAERLEENLKQKGILIQLARDLYLANFTNSGIDSTINDPSSRAIRLCISGVPFEDLKAISIILYDIQTQNSHLI